MAGTTRLTPTKMPGGWWVYSTALEGIKSVVPGSKSIKVSRVPMSRLEGRLEVWVPDYDPRGDHWRVVVHPDGRIVASPPDPPNPATDAREVAMVVPIGYFGVQAG